MPQRYSARSSDGPVHVRGVSALLIPAKAIGLSSRARSRSLDGASHCSRHQPGPTRLLPGSPTLAPPVVNATELGCWMVFSNTDTPAAAIAANNKAARKIFMTLPQSDFVRSGSFGRHGARSACRRRVALGLFFLDPER